MLNAVPTSILAAEDDPDDCRLLERAFAAAGISNPLFFAKDGQELLDQLFNPDSAPRPGLILLDLNMPRVSGKEALKQIRSDRRHGKIPVIVLSTSHAPSDVAECYALGANSYLAKPQDFNAFVDLMKLFKRYWLENVELPQGR